MNEKLSCREAFTSTLLELAKADPSIIVLTSDAKGSSSLGAFAEALPEQFLEIGIAEQNEVGVAAGLACVGRRPFICAPASFLSARSLEQVKVDVAYSHNNVKLFGVSGGISYGPLGATHHSLHDIAVMRAFPDLQIFIPSDPQQTRALAKYLAASDAPAYIRVGKASLPALYDPDFVFVPGKANMLKDGTDLTFIACGELVHECLKAAELLEQNGCSARVLDMHTLKPLDEEAILSAAKETKLIITAEEHSIYGGLGAAVAQVTAASCPVKVKSLAIPDEYTVSGTTAQVFHHYGLDAEGICRTAKEALRIADMKIYFVRHGQTEWNRLKKLQGQADLPLNEQGIADAERAAEILKEIPFDAIYCSPLIRAVETAKIIGRCQAAPVTIDDALIEIAYGKYEGYDLIAAEQDPTCEIYRYFHEPQNFQADKDGESLAEFKARCETYLDNVRKKDAGKCVLAVCHGTFIRAVISAVCGLSDAEFWGKEQGNCSITIVEDAGNGWVLRADAVETLADV